MKKFLLCSICALLILSSLFIVSAADMKQVGGWLVPGGFPLDAGGISPVTATVASNGVVSVSSGGWYTDGANWGGIASQEKYTLNGLKVELEFSSLSSHGDRWICIGFLEHPDIFKVSNISSNRGYANLIRPKDKEDNSSLNWQHIEAIGSFSPGNQAIEGVTFEKGLKLTMEVKKNGDNYEFYLNGVKSEPVFSNFGKIFTDDSAHIVIAASGQNAIDNDYQYTVKVTGNLAKDAVETAAPSTTETPKAEAPKAETPKAEAPKAETPKADDSKDAPKADAPKDEKPDAADPSDVDKVEDDVDNKADVDDVDKDDDIDKDEDKDAEDDVDADDEDGVDKDEAEDDDEEVIAESSDGIGGGAIAAIIIVAVAIVAAVVTFVVRKKK